MNSTPREARLTHGKPTENLTLRARFGASVRGLRVNSPSSVHDRVAAAHVVVMGKKKKAGKPEPGTRDVMELPRLLTKEEVAVYFGVSPRTVEKWRFEGVGPSPIKVGRHLRWTVDSIKRYLAQQGANVA